MTHCKAMSVHLILAIFWFLFGLVFLLLPWISPNSPWQESSLYIGVLGFAVALVKLIRWRSSIQRLRRRQLAWEAEEQRRRQDFEERRRDRTPDPNFAFTDEPPP